MNIAAENTRYIDRQTIPAKLGRRWVIGSLACAALSLAFAPVALGPLGIVLARWQYERELGGRAQSVSRLAPWQLQDDGPADVAARAGGQGGLAFQPFHCSPSVENPFVGVSGTVGPAFDWWARYIVAPRLDPSQASQLHGRGVDLRRSV